MRPCELSLVPLVIAGYDPQSYWGGETVRLAVLRLISYPQDSIAMVIPAGTYETKTFLIVFKTEVLGTIMTTLYQKKEYQVHWGTIS